MEITLRKAHKLISKMNLNITNTTAIIASSSSTSDHVIKTEVQSAIKELEKEISDKTNLITLKFNIKDQINKANNEHQISSILAQSEAIKAKIKMLSSLSKVSKRDVNIICDEFRLKCNHVSEYSPKEATHRVNVVTSDISTEVLETIRTLTKELESLDDSREALNNTIKIHLKEEDVLLLSEYNLI